MHHTDNVYEKMRQHFPKEGARCCIETLQGEYYTWDDIEKASAKIAHLFQQIGIAHQARVAVQVEKSPEFVILYLACLRSGLVFVPLNIAYQSEEMQYFIEDAQPEVVVCSPKNLPWISKIAFPLNVRYIYTLSGIENQDSEIGSRYGSLLERSAHLPETFTSHPTSSHDVAAILYTSGTTGRSKGAMLTHENLIQNALALKEIWAFTEDDVLLHALPLFHIHGLFVACHCALFSGAAMIFLPKFDTQHILHYLPRSTVLMGVPTFYVRLLAEENFTATLASSIRLFISGSAPLLLETFQAFEQRTNKRIVERYGMSETGIMTSNPYLAHQGERKGGTVGQPLPNIHLRLSHMQNGVGEIEVKGNSVFKAYWNMPEKTASEFTPDGYFKTGDMGTVDSEGYYRIVGRCKDLIITGGYNVYPKELELLLDDMPEISESAVIGLPHPNWGETVCAVLVLRSSHHLDEEEVIARLKQKIAHFKVPKKIFILNELPRNVMGKVQKNVLRAQLQC